MRTLRKTKKCLNCNQPLSEVYDFCPLCGQENNDINVDFWFLLKDFLANYLSLDSKFFRSIKPFFFNPGYLTLRFIEGKRKSFANPVRLYIIISLIYFFLINVIVSDASKQFTTAMAGQDKETIDSLETVIVTDLDSAQVYGDDKQVYEIDSGGDTTNLWPLTPQQWRIFLELKDDETLTEQEVVDSLNVEDRSKFTQYVVKQMVRVYKRDKEYLAASMAQNLSIMMFLMLPVFALILKLMYIRRKTLYINHLIHAIHMHSYAFMVYSIALALLFWFVEGDAMESWVAFLSFVIVSTYAYVSFKRVYKQRWLKTLIKFWIVGFVYLYALIFGLTIEIFISFLIF